MDSTVEAFAHGVGNTVAEVGQDVIKVPLEHLGDVDDGLESTTCRPAVPAIEEFAGIAGIAIFPEPSELLLDGPSPRGL